MKQMNEMLITADYTVCENDFESKAILPEWRQQGQFNKGERCEKKERTR